MEVIMRKYLLTLFILFIGIELFAQVSDTEIRQAATTLGVPFEALKQFVQSYQVQNVPSGTIEISAKQLYEAFKANELQADMMYKGKIIKVNGIVAGIKKDLWDNYYVQIEGTSKYNTVDIYVINSELNKIATLKIGQKITAFGKCEGYSILTVDIKNATIQDTN